MTGPGPQEEVDDKTFMMSFVASESQRLNERVKAMLEKTEPPTEEEKASFTQDMHDSLERMRRILLQVDPTLIAENEH